MSSVSKYEIHKNMMSIDNRSDASYTPVKWNNQRKKNSETFVKETTGNRNRKMEGNVYIIHTLSDISEISA